MKTSYIVWVIVALVIIGGVIWFMGQHTTTPADQMPAMQTQTDQTQTAPAQNTTGGATVNTQTNTTVPAPVTTPVTNPATPQAVSIAISNFAFNPSQLTVKAGTKVTWTNSDSAAHTVTSNSGAFDSKSINQGGSYSFTFKTPGTYSYHCAFHPNMVATVVVTQ